MSRIILCVALIFVSRLNAAEADLKDLDEARRLSKEGKYEEALQKHIWFHENSANSPGMAGVRLSFALADWIELGRKYPKAMQALLDIRDKKTKAILEGQGTFPLFHDVSAINRSLKETETTYRLFKTIHEKYPSLARQCYFGSEDLLVAHREYELCMSYIPDYLKKFEDIRHMRETNLSLQRTNPKMNNPEFVKYTDDAFIKGTRQLIEILVGSGHKSEAEKVRELSLQVKEDERIRSAVKDADEKTKKKNPQI